METRCQKCGSTVAGDQAFCGRCGAVIGMVDAARGQVPQENLAATMVGKKLPATPPRPATRPPAAPSRPPASAASAPSLPAPGGAPRGNTVYFVIIGLVALLLVVGLFALLFLLSLN